MYDYSVLVRYSGGSTEEHIVLASDAITACDVIQMAIDPDLEKPNVEYCAKRLNVLKSKEPVSYNIQSFNIKTGEVETESITVNPSQRISLLSR